MLIQTPEGNCHIDHALVLCIDMLTSEQIAGMMEQSEAVHDLVESRMAA